MGKAVEAVGMVRKEDLKAGEGNAQRLRLFDLMSSEFADAEGCPSGSGNPIERKMEIRDIEKQIDASRTLEKINHALKATERLGFQHANLFDIEYDGSDMTLKIRGYRNQGLISEGREQDARLNRVLVEVDKAENLREAYPNYFLDVAQFASSILEVTGSGTGRPGGVRTYDLSFLSGWRRRGSRSP